MIFLDLWFWGFAAIAIPAYWISPRSFKLYSLLVASAVFQYHFAGPAGMAPVIVLAVLTYLVALLAPRPGTVSKRAVAVTFVVLVGTLAFYKYSGFLLGNWAALLGSVGAGVAPWMKDWRSPAPPLAISFFTFEFIHYLYEVRAHGRAPIRNPVHFAVFTLFFPSLACGPIKRFPDFVPQLVELKNPPAAVVAEGAKRVIRGLFKKVCIADLLFEYVRVLENVPHFNFPLLASLGAIQGFRIYYDFCGYSDMAIGLAQMLGLRLPENFDRPYFSTTLQDFWRRWHMSLSSWIRDYVYIPLGGNRAHRVFNLLAAMMLCGLWHGAEWNFVVWGCYHGGGLAAESAVRGFRPSWFNSGWWQGIFGWMVCYAFVSYGWLIFFYPMDRVVTMTREAIVSCW